MTFVSLFSSWLCSFLSTFLIGYFLHHCSSPLPLNILHFMRNCLKMCCSHHSWKFDAKVLECSKFQENYFFFSPPFSISPSHILMKFTDFTFPSLEKHLYHHRHLPVSAQIYTMCPRITSISGRTKLTSH